MHKEHRLSSLSEEIGQDFEKLAKKVQTFGDLFERLSRVSKLFKVRG
jgi:hypothetical protein